MARLRVRHACYALAALLGTSGCQMINRGDQSYVTGLRILAIKAEPPEVAQGQSTTLTALAVDTMGRQVTVNWAYCEAYLPYQQDFNTDCVTNMTASYITPFGNGNSAMMVMPTVPPNNDMGMSVLGNPDQSGGVYLPVRAIATAGSDSVTAVYHLRVNMNGGMGANQNPVLSGLYKTTPGAGTPTDGGQMDGGTFSVGTEQVTAIDPGTPLVVHSGDKLTLRALFTAASAEKYTSPGRPTDGGTSMPRMSTERLDTSLFSTAGTLRAGDPTDGGTSGMGGFMGGFMGGSSGDSTLTLDNNLPSPGGTIDVWAVGRDNRGGTDFLHRSLTLQ
jgi:hypothetical protein